MVDLKAVCILSICAISAQWFILSGMADRGMGIRIFHSKEGLQSIFEQFEEESDSDNGEPGKDEQDAGSSVVTSQLRHFVIQVMNLQPSIVVYLLISHLAIY